MIFIKDPISNLTLYIQVSLQKLKKHENFRQYDSPKIINHTVTPSIENELNEIAQKEFKGKFISVFKEITKEIHS